MDLFCAQEPPIDHLKLHDAYLEICYEHSLHGQEIGVKPSYVGRVVNRSEFVARLVRLYRISAKRADAIASKLQSASMNATDWTAAVSYLMSDYGAWITWDLESGGVNGPFAFLRNDNPSELRDALGLPLDADAVNNLPLMCFEYRSELAGTLRVPTTSDAGGCLRFRVREEPPLEEIDGFGLSCPWEEKLPSETVRRDPSYPPKRPEALHSPIGFDSSMIYWCCPRPVAA